MYGVRDALARVRLVDHDLRQGEGALAILVGEAGFWLSKQAGPPTDGLIRSAASPRLGNCNASTACDHHVEIRPFGVRVEPGHERLGRVERVAARDRVDV